MFKHQYCYLCAVIALISIGMLCALVNAATVHTSYGKSPLPNHRSSNYSYEHSSGYVLVEPIAQKHYWYYFQQAKTNPTQKPVILFLNGGPGCSSMEYFGSGIGSVDVSTDGKVTMQDNYYSWNQFANIIYLDAPAGVGYSYANDTSVYTINSDDQTAKETRTFLIEFLTHYSQFRNNDFYISGASYGGKYVPSLAKLILDENQKNEFVINLKGITLGNPLINWQQSAISSTLYYQSIGLIDKASVDEVSASCGWSDPDNWLFNNFANNECKQKFGILYNRAVGGLNVYNLFADSCVVSSNLNSPACQGEHLKKYMNLATVQSFFKVRPQVNWDACYPENGFDFGTDLYINGLPTLQYLIDKVVKEGKNLKILIYTGDMDGSTPIRSFYDVFAKVTGVSIRQNVTTYNVDSQIAGRKTVYDGFTYATVRGAGHIAPLQQPARVYSLVSNFITTGSIPDSTNSPSKPATPTVSVVSGTCSNYLNISVLLIMILALFY